MGEPRIRFDILANAEGKEDVAALARELDKLDEAVDPQAAAQARKLADEIRLLADKRQAVQQFVDQLKRVREADQAMASAQEAAQRYGRELAGVNGPTKAFSGQMEKLKDAVKAARLEQQQSTRELDNARGTMGRLGLSTTDLSGSQARLNAALQGSKVQVQQLAAGYQQTAAAASASAATQATAHRSIGSGITSISTQLSKLQSLASVAIGGGVFGGLARDVAQTADAYNNLGARIRIVTGEGQAFTEAFDGVFEIAKRTNTSVEETGNLFTKLAQAGKELGLSQQQALGLTETINQAIQLSGGSADSARAAIVQLVQGLQSGVLRGEEFNSIMEQSPRLSKALADGLGVTTGELRKMAQQGALTTETVIKALQGQSAAVQREFEQLPPTVGRALQNLSTEWTRYVGEVDKANGISAGAARAIGLLANNLGELGAVLGPIGKTWAAYKALDLSRTFFAQAAAMREQVLVQAAEQSARVAATSAIVANTAATAANTVAKTANAAAAAASAGAETRAAAASAAATAASVTTGGALRGVLGLLGRFTGAFGLAATAAFLFYDTARDIFKGVGTFIGEGIAKLQGYKDRTDELTAASEAAAAGARREAQAQAESAARRKEAAEAALGLTAQSKALIGEFDGLIKKGESASEALGKLSKSLKLDNVEGIQTAITALDALERKGAITADQLRETLGDALKGLDLGKFEAQAIAAFDGTEQGARRLAAALDAIADESLKRVGTSAAEIATGFNEAAVSAINDVDALARTLDKLGVDSERAGTLLAKALNKAADAASTEKAVEAVIARLEELGRQGQISGDQLADGLDKAKRKLDEMQSGVNSLAEAYKTFGITSREELQRLAEKNRQAWELIRSDATLSLEQKQAAFKKYAESAIAANGGVADSMIKNQAHALKLSIDVDKTGKAFGEADGAVGRTTRLVNALGEEINKAGERLNQLAAGFNTLASTIERNKSVQSVLTPSSGNSLASDGSSVLGPGGGAVSFSSNAGSFTPPNLPGQWVFDHQSWQLAGGPLPQGPNDHSFFKRVPGSEPSGGTPFGGTAGAPASSYGIRAAPALAPTPAPVTMNITIGSNQHTVPAASQSAADALIKALEDAYKAGGGP